MRLPPDPASYHAYLLRCWLERGPGSGVHVRWRFSLEDPHTGARRGFAGLAALVAFLERVLTGDRDGSDEGDRDDGPDTEPTGTARL